jgi:hypothetical protein
MFEASYRNNHIDNPRPTAADRRHKTTGDIVSLLGKASSRTAATYSGTIQPASDANAKFSMLQALVVNLLQQQGITTKIAASDGEIDLAALTPAQAQELVSEDGYFGVEKTSERIFQFAVAIAGGDPDRIDVIKAGIDKGFAEAQQAFGGQLPDISYNTYDAVMRKLDEWATNNTVAA